MTTTLVAGEKLQEWANAHPPAENLIYKGGYWDQIIFVRDTISQLLSKSYEEYKTIQAGIKVISHHTSKSVCLPVYSLELADGTKFTMRYNFYDWKVSVSSVDEVNADFMNLFDPSERIHECYCEGFPSELVYGSYNENKRQFTIELPPSNYQLFTFFWVFAHKVLGKGHNL
jgi:hypothetical protein